MFTCTWWHGTVNGTLWHTCPDLRSHDMLHEMIWPNHMNYRKRPKCPNTWITGRGPSAQTHELQEEALVPNIWYDYMIHRIPGQWFGWFCHSNIINWLIHIHMFVCLFAKVWLCIWLLVFIDCLYSLSCDSYKSQMFFS